MRRVLKLFAFCEKVVVVSLDQGKAVLFPDHGFRKTLDAVCHSPNQGYVDKIDEPKVSGPFMFLKGWNRDWYCLALL